VLAFRERESGNRSVITPNVTLPTIPYGTKDGPRTAVDSEKNFYNSDCDDQNHHCIVYSQTGRPNRQPHKCPKEYSNDYDLFDLLYFFSFIDVCHCALNEPLFVRRFGLILI